MPPNPDFKDLLQAFDEEKVEYLIIGAYAVFQYAEPRTTKDLDVWVNPAPDNARRVFRALAKFGAPLGNTDAAFFTNLTMVYQIGVDPNRIDILTGVGGLDFAAAWERRVESTFGGVPIHVIGRDDLIQSKKIAGRWRDLLDIELLRKHEGSSVSTPKAPSKRRKKK